MKSPKTILLTIDVEDWFQVENFRPLISFATWDQHELRVERNVHQLLNLFDSIELIAHSSKLPADQVQSSKLNAENQKETRYALSAKSDELGQDSRPKATFFVLGWIAERLPHLVRVIQSRGHEIASHGYNHSLYSRQSHADLKRELVGSKKLLEDITGSRVFGFRAPNFSIDDDILKIIEDCGYLYDSSYNSFALHSRYGKISLNGHAKKGIALQISDNFFELPISNLCFKNPMNHVYPIKLFREKQSEAHLTGGLSAMTLKQNDRNHIVLPWGGGGYFRLIPYRFFRYGVQSILKRDGAYMFYIHPWELDPDQPGVDSASRLNKFKHYTNIRQTEKKLRKLINNLSYNQFVTCTEHLEFNWLN